MAKKKPVSEEVESSGSLTVSDALKMYDDYKDYWSENYREADIDLKMASGNPYTHYGLGWDSKYTAPTTSMVVDNELPQYIHQVTNDIRQNVPSIKVLPVSDGDIETGDIFSGLFRAIEDHSHADEVCDTAAEYAVTCSIGFMRIDHDYCDDETDEQEIIFKIVPDPLSNFLDPASVEYDGRDANGAICLETISRKDFDRLYPKKAFSSFTDPKTDGDKKDSIIIAEIFVREISGERGKKYTVRRYKFSGEEMLGETTFPGKYIPLVPIYGQVTWIDGKRVLQSLIRQARSPQRRLNHMLSKESQVLAMAPMAPFLAVEGTIVNERKQWQIPGLENVIEWRKTDLDGNDSKEPTRLQPPSASAGFLEAIASAKEAIKASMGIYNAGLGKREGNASGIALEQLDRSGDVATFHYPDNVRRSYGHMGEIAVEMIPIIYDTPRIVQTLNDETDVVMVGINGAPMQPDQKQQYDLRKGKYRVRITTGASYTTKRQEESAFLQEVFKADPELIKIGGDILFKSMDTPGAQAMAARMKKMLPPQLLDDSKDPQVIALTQELQKAQQIIQQGAQELQQLQTELKSKQADDQAKLMTAGAKVEEVEVKKGELKLKYLEAAKPEPVENNQPPTQEQSSMPPPSADEPIEVLHARIQHKVASQQQAAIDAQQQAQQQAMLDQQQVAMEAQELQLKQADIQLRAQQGDALIQAIGGIANRLDQIAIKADMPIQIIRDENGVAVGAR